MNLLSSFWSGFGKARISSHCLIALMSYHNLYVFIREASQASCQAHIRSSSLDHILVDYVVKADDSAMYAPIPMRAFDADEAAGC